MKRRKEEGIEGIKKDQRQDKKDFFNNRINKRRQEEGIKMVKDGRTKE